MQVKIYFYRIIIQCKMSTEGVGDEDKYTQGFKDWVNFYYSDYSWACFLCTVYAGKVSWISRGDSDLI